MKTKLLLAGLLAGAMAFGTACKTGNTNTGTGTDTTTMGTDAGTGGAGLEEPMDRTDTLGGETSEEPLNPGAPATGGNEGSMRNDEGTSKPRH